MNDRFGFRSQRGVIGVLIGLMVLPLIGFLALTVDTGVRFAQRARAQSAADAAALACVIQSAQCPTGVVDPNISALISAVNPHEFRMITENPVACPLPDTQYDCARATAIAQARLLFGDTRPVAASAIAGHPGHPAACLIALNGVVLKGGAEILGDACSNHFGAFDGAGSAMIRGEFNYLYGGHPAEDCGAHCEPAAISRVENLVDPVVAAQLPTFSEANPRDNPNGCAKAVCELSPGYYPSGIDCSGAQSDCRLARGLYFLDGPLRGPANNGRLTDQDSGVLLMLRGAGAGALIDLAAGGAVSLTAYGGATGDCASAYGQLLFHAPGALSPAREFRLRGGPDMRLTGNVHLPGHAMSLQGNDTLSVRGTVIVGGYVTLGGTPRIVISPAGLSCVIRGPAGRVALVL